jgi:preprotein translocase subunit SecY
MVGGGGPLGGGGGKAMQLNLMETLRLAWADPDLRGRLTFVFAMFAVFALGVHISVPIPGVTEHQLDKMMNDNTFLALMSSLGGGALRRVSIFSLGLNPYITASIIMQILTTAYPQWKKELEEGGQYARQQQNRRTRLLSIVLCFAQGFGFVKLFASAIPAVNQWQVQATTIIFWTAGAMFVLWLGEQISEKGIGNGVSLMIFAGIIISMPYQISNVTDAIHNHVAPWWAPILLIVVFLATTWFIVLFTTAQRRLPIQHMRRQVGTRMQGGSTSYLPLSLNLAGVIPLIFAISLVYMPAQFAGYFPQGSTASDVLINIANYMSPSFSAKGIIGCIVYTILIFFFTYFYTAVQYSVEDMSNNLKRAGSFIPGVRPGKQTKDFLDAVISRITFVGAAFLAVIALAQYIAPAIAHVQRVSIIGGTTLLIMVSVALETMRQIEANLLMKQYGT